MSRPTFGPISIFRTIVFLGLLLFGSGMIGAGLGRLLMHRGAAGETVATGLAVCGGIWALVLLVGMVLVVPQSMLGEYFWLVAPLASALSIGIGLGAFSDANWTTISGHTVLGSLGSYGLAVGLHLLMRRLRSRSRV